MPAWWRKRWGPGVNNRVSALLGAMEAVAEGLPQTVLMEVCGTHTAAIERYAIRSVLPPNLRLISGPGCPVCVTPGEDVLRAVALAKRENVILACFGDMLRVPANGQSLMALREAGKEVRVVDSPLGALAIAQQEPEKQTVFFAVGFETTAPATAVLIQKARALGLSNLSVLCAHKTMPMALKTLLGGKTAVNGLLCPGHVAAVAGAEAFAFVGEALGLPGVVAGFEGEDLLLAILALTRMIRRGEAKVKNLYPRAVPEKANPQAKALIQSVFSPANALWRGLGEIPESGLAIRREYGEFDAAARFDLPEIFFCEPEGCLCPSILRGEASPGECPLFGGLCTPQNPVGPCMVSAEGACGLHYRYEGGA